MDGKRVALVDTVEDFEEAIDTLDCPIIAPDEVARAFEMREVTRIDSAERDHVWQAEEDHWTTLPEGEQQPMVHNSVRQSLGCDPEGAYRVHGSDTDSHGSWTSAPTSGSFPLRHPPHRFAA